MTNNTHPHITTKTPPHTNPHRRRIKTKNPPNSTEQHPHRKIFSFGTCLDVGIWLPIAFLGLLKASALVIYCRNFEYIVIIYHTAEGQISDVICLPSVASLLFGWINFQAFSEAFCLGFCLGSLSVPFLSENVADKFGRFCLSVCRLGWFGLGWALVGFGYWLPILVGCCRKVVSDCLFFWFA